MAKDASKAKKTECESPIESPDLTPVDEVDGVVSFPNRIYVADYLIGQMENRSWELFEDLSDHLESEASEGKHPFDDDPKHGEVEDAIDFIKWAVTEKEKRIYEGINDEDLFQNAWVVVRKIKEHVDVDPAMGPKAYEVEPVGVEVHCIQPIMALQIEVLLCQEGFKVQEYDRSGAYYRKQRNPVLGPDKRWRTHPEKNVRLTSPHHGWGPFQCSGEEVVKGVKIVKEESQ